ncbi:hypothetical protein LJC26_01655 [Desulfovibrio sp. OttesenSCG-928-O18]|nr:hypothetical protein [Desulfovibrio sp. OttesenSCG-928-O18]
MKWWKILTAVMVLSLACAPANAEPSVERKKNIFTIAEGVNDDILAQVKAEMGQVNQQELGFVLEEIADGDLTKLCAAYPGMYALTIKDSEELSSLAPVAGLKSLRKIMLQGENMVADFTPLAGLTEMLDLDVASDEMGPDLKWMSGLTKLTGIRVMSGEKLTSIEGIPALPGLGSIAISGASLKDLSPLLILPALKEVNLRGCKIADLSPLAQLPALEDLDLYGATVEDFSPLAACPKLRAVTYYATEDADYSTLGTLTQVEELKGGMTELEDISWVANLQNLKKFSVFKEQITDYSPLAKTKVEDLQIWSMSTPDNNLASLAGVTSLTKLKLWDLKKTTNFESLGGLVNLKHLIIDTVNKDGGVVDLAFLAKTPELNNLEINDSALANAEAIASCQKLSNVTLLKVTGVTSLAFLKKLPALKTVLVSKGAFPEAELSGFGKNVRVNQR